MEGPTNNIEKTRVATALNNVVKSQDDAKMVASQMDVLAQELLLGALLKQKGARDEAKRQENSETFLERYKVQLENIDKILVEIRSLNWRKDPVGEDLKMLFFRFLHENENRNSLKLYIKELNQINGPEKILSDNLREDFRIAFTEIFRLYAFTKVEPFRNVLEKVDFPFSELEKTLDDFKKFFKQEYDLEFIIPNLYIDKVNPEFCIQERGASHIRASYVIDMRNFEDNKESGTIIDFKSIGLKSERLGIDEKAKAYLYSKV